MYTSVGFLRSTDLAQAKKGDPANGFPAIKDLFTVDDFGGWSALNDKLFSDDGHRHHGDRGRARAGDGRRRGRLECVVGPGGSPPGQLHGCVT